MTEVRGILGSAAAARTSGVLHGLPKRISSGVSRHERAVSGSGCPLIEPFFENILCRIDVAVVERPAFRALPEPNTEVFGLLVAVTTATASLTGWEEPVDNNEFLSIPVGFAGKLSADFTPRGISDMERELVAPHHVLPRLRVLDKG